jgi:hypothetical protein
MFKKIQNTKDRLTVVEPLELKEDVTRKDSALDVRNDRSKNISLDIDIVNAGQLPHKAASSMCLFSLRKRRKTSFGSLDRSLHRSESQESDDDQLKDESYEEKEEKVESKQKQKQLSSQRRRLRRQKL